MNFCFLIITVIITIRHTEEKCILQNLPSEPYWSREPKKSIQCSGDFHKEVDDSLIPRSKIIWLKINNTDIPEISEGAFSTLNNLQDLRITGAGIHVIQPGGFRGLQKLLLLSLQNNKIVELNENYFKNLTLLAELNLSFNNIASISDRSFDDLRNLRRLMLKNNFITQLPKKIFDKLASIELLDISYNKLLEVDDQLFNKLNKLKLLYLNNNNINLISGTLLFNNSELEKFCISDNYLTSLDNVELANSLNVFNVSRNGIRSISFSKKSEIATFDLSYNRLHNLKNISLDNVVITDLHLDGNHLGLASIDRKIFENHTSLTTLSLANNQIKNLSTDLLEANHEIKKLNLENNHLNSVNFSKYPNSIEELRLNSNSFDSNLNISNLNSLLVFDASFNNLTQISLHFLKGMERLDLLNLGNNQISKIEIGSFKDLKSLRMLNLSRNSISNLELGVFVGLKLLLSLDLSYNKISVLSEGVFHNLRSLRILNVSYTSLGYNSLLLSDGISHFFVSREIGLAGNNWSCSLLTKLVRENSLIRLSSGKDFDVTNVDGIACQQENSSKLDNIEVDSFAKIKSSLSLNNLILSLILIVLIFKIVLKYVLGHLKNNKLKVKSSMKKNEQELELVNDDC